MKGFTTYYLEMTTPSALRGTKESPGLQVLECEIKQFQLNRFMYQLVGQGWDWTDKNPWSDDQWIAYAENDKLRTWVGYYRGSPAGYFELQQVECDTEIGSFGLAPAFIGKGFGGYLLSRALECAWGWQGTQRVWVHTCTSDHPHALGNYKARGMTLYRINDGVSRAGPNPSRLPDPMRRSESAGLDR